VKLVLHAPNVHQGGGRTLLLALLGAATRHECRLIVDQRMQLPDASAGTVAMRVTPSIAGRFAAEMRLREEANAADAVLCLGNLPPLLRLPAPTTLFVQNRLLVDPGDAGAFPLRSRFRITLERAWLRSRLRNADAVIVQTASMAELVRAQLRVQAKIMPFVPAGMAVQDAAAKDFDFIYVASGDPHKNHRTLIDAWALLAREGLRPSLCLVLDHGSSDVLAAWIKGEAARGLDVSVHRGMERAQVLKLYARSRALIFASTMESFGLPLLEAAAAGLPILAPELDYVRDVVQPAQTFDATSPVSIARAVRRHLGRAEPIPPTVSPERLLEEIERSAQVSGDTVVRAKRADARQ